MDMDIYTMDYLASRLVCKNIEADNYHKTYYETNEDLVSLYSKTDFKDKDVLSVMGSGDQLLTSYYLGARNVDTFDMNRLALYYFYLRKWSIKYEGLLLPEIDSHKWLYKLLSEVKPKTEEEKQALMFYMNHLDDGTDFNKFFYDYFLQPNGKKLYSEASSLLSFIDKDPNFRVLNLFNEIDSDNIYDIVLISNILDWARSDAKKLEIASTNLSKLVKKDGIVLCSNLVKDEVDSNQNEIFKENFDFIPYNKSKNYVYVRK